MKIEAKSYIKLFLIGISFPTIYYFIWYCFRWFGWHWDTSFNIPGFFILACSTPWSLPVLNNLIFLNEHFGDVFRHILTALAVICGFGLNFLLVSSGLKWLVSITRRSSRDGAKRRPLA